MKQKYYLMRICVAALFGALFFNLDAANALDVDINTSFYPESFASYISRYDSDNDGVLQDDERLAVTRIDFSGSASVAFNPSIFSNLQELVVGDLEVPKGGFKGLTGLKYLSTTYINGGEESFVELTGLERLDASFWGGMPDLSRFGKLEDLTLRMDYLERLDILQNKKLRRLIIKSITPYAVDISSNDSLEYIYFDSVALKGGEYSRFPKLKQAIFWKMPQEKVDVSKNKALVKFDLTPDVEEPKIKVKFGELPELTEIDAWSIDPGETLNLTLMKKIEYVTIASSEIKIIEARDNPELISLSVDGNNIENFNLSGCSELAFLYASHNKFKSIDLSKNIELQRLYAHDGELTSLDLTHNVNLEQIDVHSNKLQSIKLPKGSALESLDAHNNLLTDIDFSQGQGEIEIVQLDHNSFITQNSLGRTNNCSNSGEAEMVDPNAESSFRSECPLSPSYVYEQDGFINLKSIRDFDPTKVKLLEGAIVEDGRIKITGIKSTDTMYRVASEQCMAAAEKLGLDANAQGYKCAAMDYDNGANGSGLNHIYFIAAPGLGFDSYVDPPEPIKPSPVDPAPEQPITPQLPVNPKTLDNIEQYAPAAILILLVAAFGARRLMRRR